MYGWTYREANVQVPSTADIPTPYRFGGRRGDIVQRVLDQTLPWEEDVDPIETMEFLAQRFPALVTSSSGHDLIWAKHRGHRAKEVQVSPFVRITSGFLPMTNLFTIELVQTPERPKLVRAYPGDYIPPLPWQNTARWADGGREACVEFWCRHAYVYHEGLIVTESITDTPPSWCTM